MVENVLGLREVGVGVGVAGARVASAGVGVASAAVASRLGTTAFEVVPGMPGPMVGTARPA